MRQKWPNKLWWLRGPSLKNAPGTSYPRFLRRRVTRRASRRPFASACGRCRSSGGLKHQVVEDKGLTSGGFPGFMLKSTRHELVEKGHHRRSGTIKTQAWEQSTIKQIQFVRITSPKAAQSTTHSLPSGASILMDPCWHCFEGKVKQTNGTSVNFWDKPISTPLEPKRPMPGKRWCSICVVRPKAMWNLQPGASTVRVKSKFGGAQETGCSQETESPA